MIPITELIKQLQSFEENFKRINEKIDSGELSNEDNLTAHRIYREMIKQWQKACNPIGDVSVSITLSDHFFDKVARTKNKES